MKDIPAVKNVPFQGQRLVLRQKSDLAQAGVQGIGKAEVNNPVPAQERNRRLGPVPRQRVEPLSLPTAKDHD